MNLNSLKTNKFMIVEKFIDKQTSNSLNRWCLSNYQNDFFVDAKMGMLNTRLTTRFGDQSKFSFPEEAYSIQKKIIEELNIKRFSFPSFKDGIVCGVGFDGGDIYPHKDPLYYPNTQTIHCNILTQKSEIGGDIHIDGELVKVQEGDLICFNVARNEHSVDTIRGERERILWVFGFCIPDDEIL